MESCTENQSWYLTVGRQKVEVTEEMYRAYRAENNHVRKRAWYEHRCAQVNFAHCSGDCLACSWHTSGNMMSIDVTTSDYRTGLASHESVEDAVLNSITMNSIYAQADCLVKNGSLILQLRFEECMSVRDMAKLLGLSHTAIIKRMRIMLKYFKTNYEKFF